MGFQSMSQRKHLALLGIVAVAVVVCVWLANGRNEDVQDKAAQNKRPQTESSTNRPQQVHDDGFVSSDACRKCHPDYYESWHRTYHRSMTQVASEKTVLGNFDDVKLASRGRNYHLEREGDEFWVTMADPGIEERLLSQGTDLQTADVPIVKRRIVMTTGSHHMQGYWVSGEFPTMVRQVPWYFLIEEKRWIPREDAFISPSRDRHFMVWNDNCIVCHAVGGKPGLNLSQGTVKTQVAEFGISCEACHGPGEEHIAWREQQVEIVKDSSKDPIVNPERCDSRVSSQICGQCHSAFSPLDAPAFFKRGYTYRAGGDLEKSHRLLTFKETRSKRGNDRVRSYYWDDGTCRVGGREYLGLIESTCFKRGTLSCLSCHSMHESDPNDQLAKHMDGNDACLQCHEKFKTTLEEHTHHSATSSGSLCYNCHMPHTSYALFKGIRSHRIDSPSVANDVRTGRPNACNLCHLDQTLKWTANNMAQWYGSEVPKLDADQETIAASLLTVLKGDAVQRVVVAWHMGWEPALQASGDQWQVRFLAELLDDEYAPVRYVAGRAIRNHPGMQDTKYDFVAAADERSQSRQEILERWSSKNTHENLTPEAQRRLLFDNKTNAVQQQIIDRLVRDRNNRPVDLPE
jgi:predicted CXXCH cytochrome family protein